MNNNLEKLKKSISREKIISLYIEKNLNKKDVAKKLNITEWAVNTLLKAYNIKKDNNLILEKRKHTCLEKYGCEYSSSSPIIKEKIKQANIDKYGVSTATQLQETKDKIKQTKLERYGDANYNNLEKNRLTKAVKYNNENYNNRSKYKETMLDKYGVNNGFKLNVTKENKVDHIVNNHNYTDTFRGLFSDRDKAIEYLKDKKLSYFDLADIFNAPYYTVQAWATKLDIRDYISHTFEGKSRYEDEIEEFLISLGVTNIEKHNRTVLDGQEIDLYLPDINLGIECNGTYWHSDIYLPHEYHFNKSIKAASKGVRLIHIFQYEWDDAKQKEKIKSLLKIALGKVVDKIYARKCEVRKISNKEASILNNLVHLQNHRNAQVTYGLFYNNILVQLMSFSKHKKYQWEIIRGCPGSNNIVIGGVSKLFKAFLKDYNPDQVFSYCDFNKFDGKSYEELGMKFIGYTGPDMKYIIKGKVLNRQPSKYKEIKSQVEARIFGAGSKKYLWEK